MTPPPPSFLRKVFEKLDLALDLARSHVLPVDKRRGPDVPGLLFYCNAWGGVNRQVDVV
jgi:hypothetical protein